AALRADFARHDRGRHRLRNRGFAHSGLQRLYRRKDRQHRRQVFFDSALQSVRRLQDTDTIAAAQRRNKELTLDDYEYLKERATLIAKLGAKARGTPSQIKRNDQVLDDVFVTGATANTV